MVKRLELLIRTISNFQTRKMLSKALFLAAGLHLPRGITMLMYQSFVSASMWQCEMWAFLFHSLSIHYSVVVCHFQFLKFRISFVVCSKGWWMNGISIDWYFTISSSVLSLPHPASALPASGWWWPAQPGGSPHGCGADWLPDWPPGSRAHLSQQ